MNRWWKAVVVAALVTAVVVVANIKEKERRADQPSTTTEGTMAKSQAEYHGSSGITATSATPKTGSALGSNGITERPLKPFNASAKRLPRLVDIGSTSCVPCKMMALVLDQLSNQYSGKLEVVFVNINDEEKAAPYKIRAMPTQVLYDETGKELLRHEGYISAEEIIKLFNEHGVVITKG